MSAAPSGEDGQQVRLPRTHLAIWLYERSHPPFRRKWTALRPNDRLHWLTEAGAVLAALGFEQVGWWHDEYGFEVTKHGIAGPDNSGDPVYRLRRIGGTAEANQ